MAGILCAILVVLVVVSISVQKAPRMQVPLSDAIKLPEPRYKGDISVEEALLQRRSVREYTHQPLTLAEVSQLLWAAQGVTDSKGYRTAPSAGALYPLELYAVVGDVEGLSAGIYRYVPAGHQLLLVVSGDKRAELAGAALGQSYVREAAVDLVFSCVYTRTTRKYGYRGTQYVHMEVGHAAENVHLQAVSLGLGTVEIGAFADAPVKEVIGMPQEETPLYIMPVGRQP